MQFFCRGFRVGIRFTYKGHNLSKVYQLAYYQFCIAQFQNISIPPTEGIEMSLGGRGTFKEMYLAYLEFPDGCQAGEGGGLRTSHFVGKLCINI